MISTYEIFEKSTAAQLKPKFTKQWAKKPTVKNLERLQNIERLKKKHQGYYG